MTSHDSGLGSVGAYVPASERPGFAVLDERRQATLEHWTARLIPGEGEWPDAREADAAAYIDAMIAAAGTALSEALAALDRRAEERCSAAFADSPAEDQDDLLKELSLDPETADVFTQVLELTYEAYYRDPAVCEVMRRRTGFDSTLPHLGSEMEDFDPALLDRVRGLPGHYREVES